MSEIYDVAVIGGGINGCGCAADAAMRGLKVILIEKDDLASKTSSSSTKLIHGGLRYLETYDFKLVKKALYERQRLLNLAPHIVYPLAIVLSADTNIRPNWLIRLGLFIYDNLSLKNKLPKHKAIRHHTNPHYFKPLQHDKSKAFLFYDAATEDARLTVVNAIQARMHKALIKTYTLLKKAQVLDGIWHLTITSQNTDNQTVKARCVINATGPWAINVNHLLGIANKHQLTLVKGSHILVKPLYEGAHAYMFQNRDKRIVFVIPYHGHTMVGTTDVSFDGNIDDVHINDKEIAYLTAVIKDHFKKKFTHNDIVYQWSGVRPLIAEMGKSLQTVSRDYDYTVHMIPAPNLTIYGGKITTYRELSAKVIDALRSVFPSLPASKTHNVPLPGAYLNEMTYHSYCTFAQEKYHYLPQNLLKHYLKTYGCLADKILSCITSITDLGQAFSTHLYQVEVDYLINHEWAHTCDDIIWRRTKHGLNMTTSEIKALQCYLTRHQTA